MIDKRKKFTCPCCKKTCEWSKKVNYCPYCGKSVSFVRKLK